MIEETLRGAILAALKTLSLEIDKVDLEYPADMAHGDFSTNVAMVLSKKAGENPRGLAEKIVVELSNNKLAEIERIEIAGPGFINFHLSAEFFTQQLKNILSKGDDWGKNDSNAHKKILVEHSSPNLFKPFHIGHVMNNTIGESIVRLAKYSGAHVTAISYPSDISLGVSKALYMLLEDGGLKKLEELPEKEIIAYLGDCYVRGTKAYEDDPTTAEKIRVINAKLYTKETDGEEYKTYEKAKEINLAYFKEAVARLGSHFDDFIYESEAGREGEAIVRKNIGTVFAESEGAIIYRGEDDGLHTRVFINKDSFPTYEGKDIGLLSLKFKKFNPDLSVFITDHEQGSYFEVVLAAAQKINKEWVEKSIHRTHGRMSFKGQKMSSRLGGVPLAETVLETVSAEVAEKSAELGDDAKEKIAIAALKFSILHVVAGKNINFDPDTSLSFEGDTGPYLQYTAVRAGSILVKAKEAGLSVSDKKVGNGILELERMLSRFPSIVAHAQKEWAPHHVVGYLLNLTKIFNSWYGNTKIVDVENPDAPYNLALTSAVKQTVTNGLYLLGIEVPEKM